MDVPEKILALELKVQRLYTIGWVAVGVAAVFGLSGAWGYYTLRSIRNELSDLDGQLDVAQKEIDSLNSQIDEEIKERVSAGKTEIDKYVKVKQGELGLSPDKLVYREKSAPANPGSDGTYLFFDAEEEGFGWRVVGAGAWYSGGTAAPVRFDYLDHDVATWLPPGAPETYLTVVLLKVE